MAQSRISGPDGLHRFTVIGVYADNDNQRYAEYFWADDTDHAEEQAHDSARSCGADLIVAAVIAGEASVAA